MIHMGSDFEKTSMSIRLRQETKISTFETSFDVNLLARREFILTCKGIANRN